MLGELGYNHFPVSLNYFTALPDAHSINNPNIAVLFKLLSKKDVVTKERALGDIVSLIRDLDEFDPLVVEAWIQMYAKLATDNSRQVRFGAHTVMSTMVETNGKAMAKYMKLFVGVWLSGVYDPDRVVAKQARAKMEEALDKEKVAKLWSIFAGPITNYCHSVILIESIDTLSDKRYVKPEDALGKYQRVVATALAMLTQLDVAASDAVICGEPVWETIENCVSVESAFNSGLIKSFLTLAKTVIVSEGRDATFKALAKNLVKRLKFKIKNSVVLSLVVVQLWDVLVVATKCHSHKKLFWEYGGLKAEARIVDWLKLGLCNSDPIYYSVVSRFFQDIKTTSPTPVDFDDEDVAKVVTKVLLKQLPKLNSQFLPGAVATTVTIGKLFGIDDALEKIVLYTAIDALASAKGDVKVATDALATYALPQELETALESALLDQSPIQVFKFSSSVVPLVKTVLSIYPHSPLITNIEQRLVDGSDALDDVFALIIDSLRVHPRALKSELVEAAPSFITREFYQPPIDLLAALLQYHPKLVTPLVVNDYFFKVNAEVPLQRAPLLLIVSKSINLYDHRSQYSDEYAYISRLATTPKITSPESQLVYHYSEVDPEIRELVVKVAGSDEKLLSFIQSNPRGAAQLGTAELLSVAWKNITNPKVTEFMGYLDHTTIASSLLAYRGTNVKEVSTVVAGPEWEKSVLEYIQTASNSVNMVGVAISNPLGGNVALATKGSSPYDENVVAVGNVVAHTSLPYYIKGLFREYIQDYGFVTPNSVDHTVVDLLSVQPSSGIFTSVVEDTHPLSEYLTSVSQFSYQCARVLYRAMANEVDAMSTAPDTSKWQVFPPFKMAALVHASTKFFGSMERLQNYCFSEIVGAKHLLTTGLQWTTLALNFLDEAAVDLPHQRLNMVTRQISSWLDLSIAYDAEFIPLRTQITRLILGLMKTQRNTDIGGIAANVVDDNLSICTTEPQEIELRYFSVKLMTELETVDPEQVEDLLLCKDIQDYDHGHPTPAVTMCHEIVERLYLVANIRGRTAKYYELLASTNSVAIQRVCVGVLLPLVVAQQHDYVIDYQLDTAADKKAVLPQQLVDIIHKFQFQSNIEDDLAELTRYVWAWVVVFAFFDDITFAMKQNYLDQLKTEGVIEPLLLYIFYQVYDLGVLKLSVFSLDLLPKYDLSTKAPLSEEMAFLLLHLYYQSCSYFGPQVQLWYKLIRDLQLKRRVDKATSSYVSPVLVGAILDDVTKHKQKLQGDDNLTIKVNRVSNEIKSTYLIDDQTMEMVIKLPTIYPLENVSVEGPLRLGVKEKQWKAWLMASQSVISLTNGLVGDAIEVFNRNVTLHFSGFEDCAICYSILHQDLSLPSKLCPTCSNKFHAACLYKWFKSSGSSTCPMCRGQFNFRKQA